MVAATRGGKDLGKRLISIVFCLVFCFLILPPFTSEKTITATNDSGVLSVHFIDVGQGDAVFVQLPDDKTLLIDSGPESASDVVVNYIKSLEVTTINYVILTHSDDDHSGGMVAIFENFEVENIFRPFVLSVNIGILPDGDELAELYIAGTEILSVTTNVYASFIRYAYIETFEDELSNIFINCDGQLLFSTSAEFPYTIEFHNPPKVSAISTQSKGSRAVGFPTKFYGAGDSNSPSAIVSLTYGDEKFLFCGDSTEKSEADFVDNLPMSGAGFISADSVKNVSVLMVPHHGSKTSSSQKFLNVVKPSYAVISVGAENTYGHPTIETLERLNALWLDEDTNHRIFRTDINKNIVVSTSGVGLSFSLGAEFEVSEDPLATPPWVIYVVVGVAVAILVFGIVYKILSDRRKDSKKSGQPYTRKNKSKGIKKSVKTSIRRSVRNSIKK